MNNYKYMTLKEAITEYVDVEDLRIFFYKNEDYTFLERKFFKWNRIDDLNCIQRKLVELNLNTMCEVILSIGTGGFFEEGKICSVVIRVGKTNSVTQKYREKFRRKEETK